MVAFKPSFVLVALFVSAMAIPTPQGASKPFTLQNGKDAISQNQAFQSLTPDSSCTSGQEACVQDKFAQCVNGKFALTPCGSGTICAALPLVNKAGTSITCTTEADKNARIAATGASDPGAANSGSSAPAPAANAAAPPAAPPAASPAASPAAASSPAPAPAQGAKPFTLQNGKDAQKLNASFSSLTANSPCTAGQNACVNGQFGQCVAGKFVLTSCGATLQCAALPLVNSPGTSITCVDNAQAVARMVAAGVGSSLTGQ